MYIHVHTCSSKLIVCHTTHTQEGSSKEQRCRDGVRTSSCGEAIRICGGLCLYCGHFEVTHKYIVVRERAREREREMIVSVHETLTITMAIGLLP